MGKASDVDGGVQGTTWDATTEAVSSGTDASVIAGADSAFSGFQCIGTGQGKGRSHGRDLGERRAADHREEGEDAEDGEQKRHAIHIAGWRATVKSFREESLVPPRATLTKCAVYGGSQNGVNVGEWVSDT